MKSLKCSQCGGRYVLRNGKFGFFGGCSNYPNCKSTKKIYELALQYITTYGIGVYCWERNCWKCKKDTPVYSYYLDYELADIDGLFANGFPTIGLGDLSYIDQIFSKKYPSVQMKYSNITKTTYMANICIHCGMMQGRNYVVDDPHEIIIELWHDRSMGKYLIETIKCEDTHLLEKDIKEVYMNIYE